LIYFTRINVRLFRKSDINKSTDYLTKYLQKVSDKEGDIQYARACSALGFIHNTLVRKTHTQLFL